MGSGVSLNFDPIGTIKKIQTARDPWMQQIAIAKRKFASGGKS
jgi:hypothetical protein